MADVIQKTNLMTAQQFQVAEGLPAYCELVKGKVIEMNRPSRSHGDLHSQINMLVRIHAKKYRCGSVQGNDSGVLTRADPDTVRGPDVAYTSFERIEKGQMPDDYSGPAPEVVFEVLSKSDRWPKTLGKTAEYLGVDVQVVCIVDPVTRTARLFRQDGTDVTLTDDETLRIPEIKPTFECQVRELFE